MIPDHILFPVTGIRFQYPFYTMSVGDYFLVTIYEVAKSAYNSARHHSKVNPRRKFAKLRVDHGWRIIRVA